MQNSLLYYRHNSESDSYLNTDKWQDFRTGPYFIMHTAFVLKEQ